LLANFIEEEEDESIENSDIKEDEESKSEKDE
jgi:hypothetical protein